MPITGYKLKSNRREKQVQEEGIKEGWEVLYKGWPDFLFYRINPKSKKIEGFCIEVKANAPKNRKKSHCAKLSVHQQKMIHVLKHLGIETKIIYKD